MKQSSTSVVVMSDAERRERLRNRIYAVFPVVSVLLRVLRWWLARGAGVGRGGWRGVRWGG